MKNRVVSKGERECGQRYQAIQKVLSRYERRITMLDIGASEGYFSLRAADDFDCVSVMIEGGGRLYPICIENANPHTILLNRRVHISDLDAISRCEHFDVVLALNVLHHFNNPSAALNAILRMGDVVIIEVPPVNDYGSCGQHLLREIEHGLSRLDKVELCRTPSHTSDVDRVMWEVIKDNDNGEYYSLLTKHYIDSPSVLGSLDARIVSNRSTKTIDIEGKDTRDWIHGINLRTYQRFGVYPSPPSVVKMLQSEYSTLQSHHGDIRPWNFILDGERTHLIDGGDSKAIYDDEEGIQITIRQIEELG
jgi:hypothetical protein